MPTLEEYVAKHETQFASGFKGKPHLEGLDDDVKFAVDRYHIDKVMADTNYLHGDGLFPLRENGQLIDLNGKVTDGGTADMKVDVNDYLALIDGYDLGNKELDPNKTTSVLITSADTTNPRIDIVCLKPALDAVGKRQHAHGQVYAIAGVPAAEPVAPEVPAGSIKLAEVRVNANVTAITNADITDARDYLLDIDDLNKNLRARIDEAVEEAKREVYAFIADQIEAVGDEIAAGDNAVRTELQTKIDLVKADIADLNVSVTQIQTDLADLRSYVDTKVALLTSITDALSTAVQDLQDADDDTEAFKVMVNDKIADIEGELLAIQESVQTNLQRIETLEQQGGVSAGLGNLVAMVNVAKTNFKVDGYHNAYANNMFKGWVDVFSSIDDIDPALSVDWEHVAYLKYIQPSSGLEPALKGLWHFDEGQGTVAVDYSGNNNHGTLTGSQLPAWVAGKFSYGLEFETGTSNIVYTPKIYTPSLNAFSVELWVNMKSAIWGRHMISKWNYGRRAEGFHLRTGMMKANGKMELKGRFGDGTKDYATVWGRTDGILPVNQWTHIVIVWNQAGDNKAHCYINGTKITDRWTEKDVNYVDSDYVFHLGRFPWWLAGFSGVIDEVAYYTRALTDAEITTHATTYPWAVATQAVIVTKAHTATAAPGSVLLVAEGDPEVTYEVSRDDGTTWTPATVNALTDISLQPAGTAMRVKATIPAGKKLDDIALFWA
ncbi:MAG: LamG-like jellyroll fold domain-containing protein [Candidatus Nanoarchaeia archaeon]